MHTSDVFSKKCSKISDQICIFLKGKKRMPFLNQKKESGKWKNPQDAYNLVSTCPSLFKLCWHLSTWKEPYRRTVLKDIISRNQKTIWLTRAVEKTWNNTINAWKNLVKLKAWRIINSTILKRNWTNVCNAVNHLLRLVTLKSIWKFTLEKNYTSVHNVSNHSVKL